MSRQPPQRDGDVVAFGEVSQPRSGTVSSLQSRVGPSLRHANLQRETEGSSSFPAVVQGTATASPSGRSPIQASLFGPDAIIGSQSAAIEDGGVATASACGSVASPVSMVTQLNDMKLENHRLTQLVDVT